MNPTVMSGQKRNSPPSPGLKASPSCENLLHSAETANQAARPLDRIRTIDDLINRKPKVLRNFKEPGFADRQKAAQEARKDIVAKFRAKPGPDDPAVAQRRAEREAHAAEREKTRKLRELEKAEKRLRDAEAAEQAAIQAVREKAEMAEKAIALEAERKAARDARYAARKSRK